MTNKLWLSGINVKDEREDFGLLPYLGRKPKEREMTEGEREAIVNAARNSEANKEAYLKSDKAMALLREEGKTEEADAIETRRDLQLDLL